MYMYDVQHYGGMSVVAVIHAPPPHSCLNKLSTCSLRVNIVDLQDGAQMKGIIPKVIIAKLFCDNYSILLA